MRGKRFSHVNIVFHAICPGFFKIVRINLLNFILFGFKIARYRCIYFPNAFIKITPVFIQMARNRID